MTRSRPSPGARLIGLAAIAICVTTGSALRLVPAVSAADKPRAERPVSPVNASLAYALIYVALWWAIM